MWKCLVGLSGDEGSTCLPWLKLVVGYLPWLQHVGHILDAFPVTCGDGIVLRTTFEEVPTTYIYLNRPAPVNHDPTIVDIVELFYLVGADT